MAFNAQSQYLTERFLEAFDETRQRYGLRGYDMEEIFDRKTKAPMMVSEYRRFFARRMFRPDEQGRKCKVTAIALVLGASVSSVEKMVNQAVNEAVSTEAA